MIWDEITIIVIAWALALAGLLLWLGYWIWG